MAKSGNKDLSEEEDTDDPKEKEDSGSDKNYEDKRFWSVIHRKRDLFFAKKRWSSILTN